MPPPPSTPDPAAGEAAALAREDAGYHHDLNNRQMQMIAIGGAIGTGLFMGAGARLASAGPGLFLIYGICGGFVFLILRALGELVLHRPGNGLVRLLCARILRGESGFRRRLDVLPELGDGGDRGQHRDRELLPLLDRIPGGPAVDARARRPGGGGVGQPDLGEGLRRVRVLGGTDQGDGPDDVPGRRHRLPGRPLQDRGKDHRAQPVGRPRRVPADRPAAAGARHLRGDIRLRRSRIGRHRSRGNRGIRRKSCHGRSTR